MNARLAAGGLGRRVYCFFTTVSQTGNGLCARGDDRVIAMETAEMTSEGEVLRVGALEIRANDGLVVAGGQTVTLSVREFGLLVALARRARRIVRREDLFRLVWDAPLRTGDRSIDVYVHKLRVKLETALPEWRFIHTHVGFGYRLEPELSGSFQADDAS